MAVVSTIVGGASAAGINFRGIGKRIGGLFGGGSSPNYGNANFVDVLDNYEGISSSRARTLQTEIENIIRSGGSDRQIGRAVSDAGGYNDFPGVMESSKWDLIQPFIDQARQNLQAEQSSQNNTGGGGRSVTGGRESSGSSGGIDQNIILWGALGFVGLFFITRG